MQGLGPERGEQQQAVRQLQAVWWQRAAAAVRQPGVSPDGAGRGGGEPEEAGPVTWLAVGGVLLASMYPAMAVLGRTLPLCRHLNLRPRRIAVAATVVPPIRSHRPVPGWPPAPVLEGRAVRGEVEK
jgi:hypothetical protein